MHQIETYQTGSIVVGTAVEASLSSGLARMEAARENKRRIMEGALSVETQITGIILHHFFPEQTERKTEFDLMILRSDWCSFSAKRKLVAWVVQNRKLLSGPDWNRCDKLLRETMAFRNAFTHGHLLVEHEAVFLAYFEGRPRKQELTDEFLIKVEETLTQTYHSMEDIAVRSGTTTRTTSFRPQAGDELKISHRQLRNSAATKLF